MGQSRPHADILTGKSWLEKEPLKRLRESDEKLGMSARKDGSLGSNNTKECFEAEGGFSEFNKK